MLSKEMLLVLCTMGGMFVGIGVTGLSLMLRGWYYSESGIRRRQRRRLKKFVNAEFL